MDLVAVRALALALPGTSEEPHFHYGSFRVGGKIYVTVPPEGDRIHVFVEEAAIDAACAAGGVEELWWGQKRLGVRVFLDRADAATTEALVRAAWRRRAPKRVVAAFERG